DGDKGTAALRAGGVEGARRPLLADAALAGDVQRGAKARGAGDLPERPVQRRSARPPLAEPGRAELKRQEVWEGQKDRVPGAQHPTARARRLRLELDAVDKRPVLAAEILDVEVLAVVRDARVPARHPAILGQRPRTGAAAELEGAITERQRHAARLSQGK